MMNRKFLLFLVVSFAALIVTVTTAVGRSQTDTLMAQGPVNSCTISSPRRGMGWGMGSGMMGDNWGTGSGMMGGNAEDMQVVHQLFAYHNQTRRSVDEIPGGVQTLTESDNPEVAELIQRHVAIMHQRLDEGRWFAMMSQTLPILFQNAERYQRQSQATSKGISVTKTSEDPELAAVLRAHAEEVSQFVQQGMPCRGGMMFRR